jgi:hypothetical protein
VVAPSPPIRAITTGLNAPRPSSLASDTTEGSEASPAGAVACFAMTRGL